MPDCTWDVIVPTEVCPAWADYATTTQDIALWLASTWLDAATGRRYGPCPVTIQPRQSTGPCGQAGAGMDGYRAYPALTGDPGSWPGGVVLAGGRWFNCGCGSGCCGTPGCSVILPGPVADVTEVTIDGEPVSPALYEVAVSGGEYHLTRVGADAGQCWPCDGLEVTYLRGLVIPEALAIATAMLACTWAKGIEGGDCGLPPRMTSLSRQGVDIQIQEVDATGGALDWQTGIAQVDQVVAALNPGRLRQLPSIFSPDMPGACDRIVVVPAGGSS